MWPVKTVVFIQGGLESKKNSSRGRCIFLDFAFYRTIFELLHYPVFRPLGPKLFQVYFLLRNRLKSDGFISFWFPVP